MSRALQRIAARLAYVVVLLLSLELVSRWLLSSDARFFELASRLDEPSWRIRWVKRHEKGEVYPNAYDLWHATRGWTTRAGLRDVPIAPDKTLSTTSRGARGTREHAVPKPPGAARILAIGDSFTFGEGVGDSETWPAQLEARLSGVEVVNLGVHGYGHDQMLITLREEARRYGPDVVILGAVNEDTTRNLLAFRDYAKPRFVLREGALELRNSPVPKPEDVFRREWRRSRLVDLLTMVEQRLDWKLGSRQREMEALTRALLVEIFRVAREAGAKPAVAALPVGAELSSLDIKPREERALEVVCREESVPLLSLWPRFAALARAGARLTVQGHWKGFEHRVAAEEIGAFVKPLLPPPSAP